MDSELKEIKADREISITVLEWLRDSFQGKEILPPYQINGQISDLKSNRFIRQIRQLTAAIKWSRAWVCS
jgi:hypothetical protein